MVLVLAVFVCTVWGACSIITWAANNLPVWIIGGVAIAFVALFAAVEGSK
jgi:hypothetical protein